MLNKQSIYNDLSDILRAQLLKRYEAHDGRVIRYRFNISHNNPDVYAKETKIIFPSVFTLTPKIFSIKDPGDSKPKKIAMVKHTEETVAGVERAVSFKSVQVTFPMKGIFTLRPQDEHREETFAFLELHPENENGLFKDPNKLKYKFSRIDELKEAGKNTSLREKKRLAGNVAASFDEDQVRDFALSMGWTDTDELVVLKDKVEALAEGDPDFFERYINEDTFEYKALIGRAQSTGVITYVQAENKYIWAKNEQLIAAFGRSEKEPADLFTDWLKTSKAGPSVYKQIKELVSPKLVMS